MPYNAEVKSWDAIVIGGGVIGMSLAIELRKQRLSILVVERGEPGREASYAAAGMLAPFGAEMHFALQSFAEQSARLYPEFVHELEDESGIKIDFREYGTILLSRDGEFPNGCEPLSAEKLGALESAVDLRNLYAAYIPERSVDPRTLMNALIKAPKHRGVDIASGSEVKELLLERGRAAGVKTDRTSYFSQTVINCAGAWAGRIGPHQFPVRPIKGQMLAVVGGPTLKHVIRSENVYLVPRSDGRIVIGSTLEDVGFNKQTEATTIEKLFHAAARLVPDLAKARQHDAWAGLRPSTPDCLPIIGETATVGYFVATGHYRDGILLAPTTAKLLADAILGSPSGSLAAFSHRRFV